MLTEKMARWEELKYEISALEADISKEVLALGKTQQVGNVRASYAKGRKIYNYEGIAKVINIPPEIMDAHTKQITDWTKIVKELSPSEEIMSQFVRVGNPTVTIKLVA